MPVEDDDEMIIRQVVDGNARAFEILIARYQDVVSKFVYKIIPNTQDREEVCQDVFVKVFQNLGTFRFEAKFTTWLFQIAYRSAISFNRKRRLETVSDEDYDIAANQSDVVSDLQIRRMLDRELAGLKLDERTIITLHYMHELSISDISQIVAKPDGTVKSILHRIRQKLKLSLQDRYEGAPL